MKKLTMVLLLAVTAMFASAQEKDYNDDEIQTIFSKHQSNGGYGAVSIGYSRIDGMDALITGARGAFIFSHSFAVGIGGYGFVNDFDYKEVVLGNPVNVGLAGGYGGIFIEPIIGARLPAHLSFPVLFGIGGVALVEDSDWWDEYYDYSTDTDAFLVVEPAIELELNLTKFLRAAAYASYRLTSDIDLDGTDPDALNGVNMGLTFKIGKF